ncbi:hypothetical protein DsansV1_C11g0110661 [Dioscorea sansibarensis]
MAWDQRLGRRHCYQRGRLLCRLSARASCQCLVECIQCSQSDLIMVYGMVSN